jgi:hypothetical protein
MMNPISGKEGWARGKLSFCLIEILAADSQSKFLNPSEVMLTQ